MILRLLPLICLLLQPLPSLIGREPNRAAKSHVESDFRTNIQEAIQTVRLEISIQEEIVETLQERLKTQEETLLALHEEMGDIKKTQKDLQVLSLKLSTLEGRTESLVVDLRKLQAHSNDIVTAFQKFDQKLLSLESAFAQQTQNLSHLEKALHHIVDASLPKDPNERIYKVKPGDSLEKIAKENQTSVKKIKERNQLLSDRITVGQTIVLPPALS